LLKARPAWRVDGGWCAPGKKKPARSWFKNSLGGQEENVKQANSEKTGN
jgi:hypothetical protein